MKKINLILCCIVVLLLLPAFVFAGGEQEKGKVTFYWALYDGLTEEYREDLESAFMAENPDTEMDIVPVAWDQMYDKLTTSLAGGTPPEISVIGTRWALEFMNLDAIEPVDKYVSKATLDNILPGTKEAVIGGKLMGLPIAAGARILVANPELTSKVPATMEELREEAIKITGNGKYGLIMPGKKHTELTDFAYYFYAAGGDFFEMKSDGSYGKSTVNSAAGVKALEFMVKLANKDKVVPPGYLSTTRMEAHPIFYSGKAGYVMIGAWVESALKQAGAAWTPMYMQIPGFKGNKSTPLIITDSITIFTDAKNKEGAGKFIDFFYQDEWKAQFDELVGFPPVTASAAKLPQFQSPLYQALNEAAVEAKPWPLMEGWAEISDTIWDAVSRAYLGEMSPKAALDEAAMKIDKLRGM